MQRKCTTPVSLCIDAEIRGWPTNQLNSSKEFKREEKDGFGLKHDEWGTERPGVLQSMGSWRHPLATEQHDEFKVLLRILWVNAWLEMWLRYSGQKPRLEIRILKLCQYSDGQSWNKDVEVLPIFWWSKLKEKGRKKSQGGKNWNMGDIVNMGDGFRGRKITATESTKQQNQAGNDWEKTSGLL